MQKNFELVNVLNSDINHNYWEMLTKGIEWGIFSESGWEEFTHDPWNIWK